MRIVTVCQDCGKRYSVDEAKVGTRVKCRSCGHVFDVTPAAVNYVPPQDIIRRTSLPIASTVAVLEPPRQSGESDSVKTQSPALPKLLLSALRGRWKWAILAGLFVGGCAAYAGWRAGKQVYTSRAELQLDSRIADYGLGGMESTSAQDYESFADGQVRALKGTRVLEKAMDNPAWRALHRGFDDVAVNALAVELQASRKGEVITVEMHDEDSAAAVTGLRAVIDAYMQIDTDENTQRTRVGADFLTSQLADANNLVDGLKRQMADRMRAGGYENFSPNDLLSLMTTMLTEDSTQALRVMDARQRRQAAEEKFKQDGNKFTGADVTSAQLQEDQLSAAWKEVHDKLDALARLKDGIEDLLHQSDKALEKRDNLVAAMDTLNRLAKTPGRLKVLVPPEKPTEPSGDTRRVYAFAGLVGGALIGFGTLVVIGLIDRRIRGYEDVRIACDHADILGLLPQLPDDLVDPMQAAEAIRCVHHIRTRLQLWYGDRQQLVLAVTGASAGTGKTSLTLALGISFAAAESRTLLIDFDLGGGGLTNRVRANKRRKIGQVLQRAGIIKATQLDTALKAAADSGLKLGEALLKLGFVEESDLVDALETQQNNPIGLLEALGGETLGDCVYQSDTPNLSVLPLGQAIMSDGGRVSPLAIQRLIDAARSRYDVVLIDTGPLPGSVEGFAAVAVADGVLMTTSRGEERDRLRECMDQLKLVGAHLAGVVYNRASVQDLVLMRLSSGERSGSPSEQEPENRETPGRLFGPFGHAHSLASGKQA